MSTLPITAVVLTWNEAANVERTLSRLDWVPRVLVVDSGSDDGTQQIARRFANVMVVERPFDQHARQWEFAIRHPGVVSDWVLALDADYVLTAELIEEFRALAPEPQVAGYRARFRYCIEGRPLRASLYPPVTVFFDRRRARFVQDGHTQRIVVDGEVQEFAGGILHDDRKPLERFVAAQHRYSRLEADRLRATPWRALPWSGRLRKVRFVAPWLVPLWVLLGRGLVFAGRDGLSYARQRLLAERMIAAELSRKRR